MSLDPAFNDLMMTLDLAIGVPVDSSTQLHHTKSPTQTSASLTGLPAGSTAYFTNTSDLQSFDYDGKQIE
jgi:hypothetical protein